VASQIAKAAPRPPVQRCSRCGVGYHPGDAFEAWQHAPESPPSTRKRGAPPKLAYTSRCRARGEVRSLLTKSVGEAKADRALRGASSAVEDLGDVLATKYELDRLEEFAAATERAFWLAKQTDAPASRVGAGDLYASALDGTDGFYTLWEKAAARLRHERKGIPETMLPLLALDAKEIVLQRLKLSAPDLCAASPTALAYWSIAADFEPPIEVRAQPDYCPTESDPFAEFISPRTIDRRPYATQKDAEHSGDLRPSETADELFAKRVNAWKHVLFARPRRRRRIVRD
jgi:hypothetical protein